MSHELAQKLLERNRVGALLRVFATKPEAVDYHVASAMSALRRLLSLRTGGRPTFSRIDFLISSDRDFDDADCGLTTERLREAVLAEFHDAPVSVLEIKKGDIYCMLLNYGVVNQLEDRIPYSMIISHQVASYATQENVDALLAAMYNKARVAGVAIRDVSELIFEGRIMNTFAIWHNKSLMTVGGFDLRAAKPLRKHKHLKATVVGHSQTKADRHGDGKIEYHVAGCEEIIPLVRFTRYFGKCIKVITPMGEGMEWKEAQEAVDPDAYHRHLAKLATKDARQRYMAELEGVDVTFIQKGLMQDPITFPAL